MIPFDKHIRIAVIGSPSSGKSFLLFDLIHAFHHLGFKVQELPLSYPHSSFGTFFYDAINAETGGMRGTERYACRPEDHYGAILTRGRVFSFRQYHVDFLNIPGEAFKEHDTIQKYFTLKQQLERIKKDVFWLSVWESPSRHVKKLILPKDFKIRTPNSRLLNNDVSRSRYMGWAGVIGELINGEYKECGKRCSVSGKYLLQHISELSTDSILLTIKDSWARLTATYEGTIDYDDYDASGVFRYFYFFTYCQLATDLVICDRLTEQHSAWQLTEDVCHFMTLSGESNPHVYLAFRGIDLFIKHHIMEPPVNDSIHMRNRMYSLVHDDIAMQLQNSIVKQAQWMNLSEATKSHIKQTCGSGIGWGFWKLLNTAVKKQPSWKYRLLRTIYSRLTVSEMAMGGKFNLPPHVFFTATPIDSEGRVYKNDTDVTRFLYEDSSETKSFLRETCSDMTRHFCFGSLQLLVDILLQNGVRLNSAVTGSTFDAIKYIQTQPIK